MVGMLAYILEQTFFFPVFFCDVSKILKCSICNFMFIQVWMFVAQTILLINC